MRSLARVAVLLALAGCSKSNDAKPAETKPAAGLYFDFTVDGKPFTVAPEDVSTTFRTVGNHAEFKIFAGKPDGVTITLTAITPMTGPSSTPNGAADVASGIHQGSVSLQEFPEKGYTTNSFNATYPEMAVVVPDAVVITAIEPDGKDARFVTGTFAAKTFGSHSQGTPDPKDTDHDVKGKFRLRHELSGERF